MMTTLPLVLSLLLLHSVVRAQANIQCSSDNVATIRFSVSSRRNATGHRLVTVTHGSTAAYYGTSESSDQLTVDVAHDTARCDGKETISVLAEASAPPAKFFRRADYELFPGLGYYKMHTVVQTWEQARQTCNKEEAHLLIVNSEAEADVIVNLFARNPKIQGSSINGWAFMGHHDHAVEGKFVTVLGQPLNSTGYSKWHKGEPDNVAWGTEPDQDCGVANVAGELGDFACTAKLAFFCEQEL